MDYRIWKYKLAITDSQTLDMPEGSEILSVKVQNGELCLWALGNTDNQNEQRFFEIFGTGHPVYQDMGIQRDFIGTVLDGGFVWHVFERS